MTPVVSVCLPVYNGGRHIAATVKSVLAQTFGDFELVVVDNASTDDTFEILRRFDDPRLRLSRNAENVGATANWNLAVDAATGRYVKLLCADDLLYPTCLAEQVEVLEAHPSVALAASRRDIVDDSGEVVVPNRGLAGMRGVVGGQEATRRVARSGTNPLGEPAAVLIRHEARVQAGPFRGHLPYMIDVDMWCRVLRHGSLYALPRTLCTFRLATGSWSEQLVREQSRQGRRFVHQLRTEAPDAVGAADEMVGTVQARVLALARRGTYAVLATRRRAHRLRGGRPTTPSPAG